MFILRQEISYLQSKSYMLTKGIERCVDRIESGEARRQHTEIIEHARLMEMRSDRARTDAYARALRDLYIAEMDAERSLNAVRCDT